MKSRMKKRKIIEIMEKKEIEVNCENNKRKIDEIDLLLSKVKHLHI